MANFLFYLMAAGAVLSALGVVIARNPISSVLSLLASFFCLSGIYLLAGFQFLAATQILVYAGAIMVLFLFVIMLLNLGHVSTVEPLDARMLAKRRVGLVLAVSAGLFLSITAALVSGGTKTAPVAVPEKGIDQLTPMASEMFGRFLLPFEATSLLLLATAVAVLVLAKRDRRARGESGAVERATAPPPPEIARGTRSGTAAEKAPENATDKSVAGSPASRAGVHAGAGAGEEA